MIPPCQAEVTVMNAAVLAAVINTGVPQVYGFCNVIVSEPSAYTSLYVLTIMGVVV